ncbi:T9SS type B sorting domain-containing protein [Psychroserpens sp. NJDZ02]|uniref:T9SS type B sorting domain-containing protein n=1 Tax=Psychroserpens sp. NJDZ02 TaxID=2570561 RepID=UPI0010A906AB|nr:T9SS type B sorting domain-containing protein [Psychroserpens sp. NJDZ02]
MIGAPNYITPNGDTYNDYWKIFGLSYNFYNEATIDIYNRYGKLLYTIDLDSNKKD